jgi:hypothetical protein
LCGIATATQQVHKQQSNNMARYSFTERKILKNVEVVKRPILLKHPPGPLQPTHKACAKGGIPCARAKQLTDSFTFIMKYWNKQLPIIAELRTFQNTVRNIYVDNNYMPELQDAV